MDEQDVRLHIIFLRAWHQPTPLQFPWPLRLLVLTRVRVTIKVLLPSCRRKRDPVHPSLPISPLSPSGKSLLSLLLRKQQGLLCSGADCQQIHPEPMHLAGEASSEVGLMQLWSSCNSF